MSWWNPVDDVKSAVKDAKHGVSDALHTGEKLVDDAYKTAKDNVKGVVKIGANAVKAGITVSSDAAQGQFAEAFTDAGKGIWHLGGDIIHNEGRIIDDEAHSVVDLTKDVFKVGGDLNKFAIDSLSAINPLLGETLRVGEVFAESAINTGFLQPLDGASQLLSAGVHELTGYKLPSLELHIKPDTQGLGIVGRIAADAGDAAGFIAPLLITGGATSALAGLSVGADALDAADVAATAGSALADGATAARGLDAADEGLAAATRAVKVAKFLDSPYKTAVDGAIAGFVFTPSNGKGNILESRFEAAGVNAITFGSMSGVSRVLSSGADGLLALTDNAAIKAATHLATNAASGVVGGAANAESSSLLSGKGFASTNDVIHDAAQFAITGTALAGVHFASQKAFEAAANLSSRTNGTPTGEVGSAPPQADTGEAKPLTIATSAELSFPPNIWHSDAAESEKQSDTTAGDARPVISAPDTKSYEAAQTLKITSSLPNYNWIEDVEKAIDSGTLPSDFTINGPVVEQLDFDHTFPPPYKAPVNTPEGSGYVYPDGTLEITHPDGTVKKYSDGVEETESTQDYGKQTKKTAADIVAKIEKVSVTDKDMQSLLEALPPEDRELGAAFAQYGLQNSNDRALMENLRLIKKQFIAENKGSDFDAYSLDVAGNSDALAYLFRKATGITYSIFRTPDQPAESSLRDVLLFGDLSKATDNQIEWIKQVRDSGHRVVHVDLNNFENGLNFIDFGTGNAAPKLKALVEQAHQVVKSDPSMASLSDQQLAKWVLNAETDNAAAAARVEVVRPQEFHSATVISQEDVLNYLDRQYSSTDDRFHAGKLLSTFLHYESFKSLTEKAVYLHEMVLMKLGQRALESSQSAKTATVDETLAAGEQSEKNAIYIVGNSSDAFISSVYRAANNLPAGRFMSLEQYNQLKRSAIANRQLIYLDDTAYTGTQLTDFMDTNFTPSLKQAPIVANFGSFKEFGSRFWSGKDSNVDLLSLAGHTPMNKQLQNYSVVDEERLQDLEFHIRSSQRGISYGGIYSYQVFPYMASDTTSPFIMEFAEEVLGI